MTLQLALEEPEAGPWRAEPLSTVIESLTQHAPGGAVSGRPIILAVDGRSNGGKTTLAARIAEAAPGSAVVHTDERSATARRDGPSTDVKVQSISLLTVRC